MFPARIAAMSACFCALLPAGCDRGNHPGMVGRMAPDFALGNGAQRTSVAQYRGREVLLNFWATDCAPCVEELPALIALHQQMPQLEIIAVSEDRDPQAYEQFLAEHPLPFHLARESDEHGAQLYGTDGYPETFVIDSRGIVRRHFIGAVNWTSSDVLDYLHRL